VRTTTDSGRPWDVLDTSKTIGCASHGKEEIAGTIDPDHDVSTTVIFMVQHAHGTLTSSGCASCHMKPCGKLATTWQDKGLERSVLIVDLVNQILEDLDIGCLNSRDLVLMGTTRRCGQIGAQYEDLVLKQIDDLRESLIHIFTGTSSEPEEGIHLVCGAIRGDTTMMLRYATAAEEIGASIIASTRVETHPAISSRFYSSAAAPETISVSSVVI